MTTTTTPRPFRVLGLQQVAIGGPSKERLRALWVDRLGLEVGGHFVSERENVDEDICTIGHGASKVEVDLMQPLDADRKPAVHLPPLNHVGLWIDDLAAAVEWLAANGVRFAPGGIRQGAAGHDVCFIHPRGNDAFPFGGEGVLIELVQAPPEVVAKSPAPQPFPLLETSRLRLREITSTDVPALHAIHGDVQRMRWFGVDPLLDQTGAEKLVATFASWRELPNPGTRWAIELKDRPGLIGTCGLFAWDRNWRKCTLGYELARSFERNGYMREALVQVIGWGLRAMDLNRIEAQVHPMNAASIKCLERLGFELEGRSRQLGHWAGRHHDLLQYSLLETEWQSHSTAGGPGQAAP